MRRRLTGRGRAGVLRAAGPRWLASVCARVNRAMARLWGRRRLSAVSGMGILALAGTVPAAAAALPWSVAASPGISGGANDLYAAAGSSAADVWAVGGYAGVPDGPVLPLAEHWAGSAWKVVPAARTAGEDGTLFGVAAISPADAWAVGDNRDQAYPNTDHGLIEHWNGTAWRTVPAPGGGNEYLTSVAAVSAGDVWAVGHRYSVSRSAFEPLFEHWNGQGWSVAAGPATGVPSRVSAVSGSDVWAIGERYSTSPAGLPVVRPVIYHFDGTRWRVQATPSLTAQYGYGDVGIDAISASDVWAFVLHGTTGGAAPVFLHWNGSSWSRVRGAALVTPDSYESFGLAFATAADGWFIGNHTTSGQIFAEHWNGTRWTAATLPNWGDIYAAAAVPEAGGFWAVGAAVDPYRDYTRTRILRGP